MRVILTGGGTGGHIYPALAIAHMLRESHPHVDILYIGTKKGLERELVPRAGIAYEFIEVEGLRRTFSLRAVKTAWMALTSIVAARRIIARFAPDVVIATGGYVAVPVIAAAHLRGLPAAILELDVHAGLANRLVYRFADTVMLGMEAGSRSFAKAKRVVFTGNPRASEVVRVSAAAIDHSSSELGLKAGMPVLTIVSGSRGASPINEAVAQWLETATELPCQVVWITGQIHFAQAVERLGGERARDGMVRLLPFYHDMPALLSRTTLLVSRAGATILAEMTALGVPAILIPSPYVTHRHQDDNAAVLVKRGAAVLLPEEQLTSNALRDMVERLIHNPFRLETMCRESRSLGRPDALQRIAGEIDRLLELA